ncbi:uncharacterized protein B0I36DRAFT_122193 [Microdochium trichocladiopsis]|uniref:BZIP domain-containing protein n=1 Tax=Microdochium trichocladiopsis TaxID=1682393 RepID=A0A9P8Y6T7_9PEZI|nr:uncharacterized protein B0I36DRAFT_122193 [Microdochium trichocladiopsis]KAH7031376.1 hypothetical protein B0I36DRAFT_122193 [Microdochium trichocladiopsis]
MPRKVSSITSSLSLPLLPLSERRAPQKKTHIPERTHTKRGRGDTQVRVPADPAQSRLNQQRSRARRREHVADLERRLREREGQAVQASVEMQAASRYVAWKNEMLMGLLERRFGVARGEVEGWLDEEWKKTASGMRLDLPGREAVRGEEEGDGVRGLLTATSGHHQIMRIVAEEEEGEEEEEECDDGCVCRNGSSDRKVTPDCYRTDTRTMATTSSQPDSASQPDSNSAAMPPPQTSRQMVEMTSCDEAADMIASLQGHGNVNDARRLLGCPNSSDCKVKNTQLFQLMVETT